MRRTTGQHGTGFAVLLSSLILVSACSINAQHPTPTPNAPIPTATAGLTGIHKIQHVVIIMQENRSFDSYFGTFPGADGIPMQNGKPTVCVPDPATGGCVAPHHDPSDKNAGGPHTAAAATADIKGGQMNGFVAMQEKGRQQACAAPNSPQCAQAGTTPDVMGWHDAREIPNYWSYAQQFVLQDHMFEPNASWSLPAHLFLVSEWSAKCSKLGIRPVAGTPWKRRPRPRALRANKERRTLRLPTTLGPTLPTCSTNTKSAGPTMLKLAPNPTVPTTR
jgi:phospholipase C